MPSDAFIGILSGLGAAHRTRQKNIFDQEMERRDQLAKAVEKLAEHPDLTPEGREQLYKQGFSIRTSDVNKKLPKELENLATEVAPKFGQSWLGGKTEQNIPLQSMPVGDLEGQPQPAPKATTGVQAPMPQPPPGAQRSIFQSSHEQANQKMSAAVEMLQALGPIQQQQALETERAKLAMQPKKPVGAFAFPAGAGIATEEGNIIQPASAPEKPPRAQPNLEAIKITLPGQAGPIPAMRYLDPDNPEQVGKIVIRTPQGLQDVTAQAKLYQEPKQPPFIIRNEAAVNAAAQEVPREWRNAITRAMPPNATQATRLARLNEATGYIAAGDTEGLKSRIRQLAIEGEGASTQAQVEGRADAMAAMKDAVGLMEDMQREGVATNILTGTWEDVLRKLGTTSHPKRVEFASRMQRALSAYTLAMSGVQFGEKEAERYAKLFPAYSNTMPVNATLANSLLKAMETEDRRFWTQKLGPDGAKLVGASTGDATPTDSPSSLKGVSTEELLKRLK